jgi:hypothetical protein
MVTARKKAVVAKRTKPKKSPRVRMLEMEVNRLELRLSEMKQRCDVAIEGSKRKGDILVLVYHAVSSALEAIKRA